MGLEPTNLPENTNEIVTWLDLLSGFGWRYCMLLEENRIIQKGRLNLRRISKRKEISILSTRILNLFARRGIGCIWDLIVD
jgi:hypothetical protein